MPFLLSLFRFDLRNESGTTKLNLSKDRSLNFDTSFRRSSDRIEQMGKYNNARVPCERGISRSRTLCLVRCLQSIANETGTAVHSFTFHVSFPRVILRKIRQLCRLTEIRWCSHVDSK